MIGRVTFTDQVNGVVGYYDYGAYLFRKQDYVWGELHRHGEKVSTLEGNYVGYLDFDGVRYWDVREKETVFYPIAGEEPNPLPSHSSRRTDGRYFISLPL